MVEQTAFIHADQLPHLEKITKLYFEPDINLESIEAITHLLQRLNAMQDEIKVLQNRLRFYESNELKYRYLTLKYVNYTTFFNNSVIVSLPKLINFVRIEFKH